CSGLLHVLPSFRTRRSSDLVVRYPLRSSSFALGTNDSCFADSHRQPQHQPNGGPTSDRPQTFPNRDPDACFMLTSVHIAGRYHMAPRLGPGGGAYRPGCDHYMVKYAQMTKKIGCLFSDLLPVRDRAGRTIPAATLRAAPGAPVRRHPGTR